MKMKTIRFLFMITFASTGLNCEEVNDYSDSERLGQFDSGWEVGYSGGANNFTDVLFINEDQGWALGADASNQCILLRTINGGKNWAAHVVPYLEGINLQSGELNRFSVVDNLHIWVAGPGKMVFTETGRASWEITDFCTSGECILLDIQFIDEDTGWILGQYFENKTLFTLRSSDGGFTWTESVDVGRVELSYQGLGIWANWKLSFSDSVNGWVLGDSLFRTADGGSSWNTQPVSSNSGNVVDAFFVDANNGFLLTWEGPGGPSGPTDSVFSYRTSDGGFNWVRRPLDLADPLCSGQDGNPCRFFPNRIFFADSSNGWAFSRNFNPFLGSVAYIGHTTDHGATWTLQTADYPGDLLAMFFLNADRGWAVGRSTKILYTSTGGDPP